MRIIHYLLGLPPVRGGGLVKYALDLAEAQSVENDVFLLVPGAIAKKVGKRKKVVISQGGNWKNIPQYRIQNPLPIPMGNGIQDIEKFIMPCARQKYHEFLAEMQPDIIHVHTLMGLHKEFLEEAKKLEIPVVFTTHDYFGICPIANLLYKGTICDHPGEHCEECCQYAFSEKRLLLEQSRAYRMYRSSDLLIQMLRADSLKNFMKKIRSQSPEKAAEQENATETEEASKQFRVTMDKQSQKPTEREYAKLLAYYREMFCLISYYHFNSNVSRQIYEQHLGKLPGEVIAISNRNVADKRVLHEAKDKLKIGFLGGDVAFKGLYYLQKLLDKMYAEGKTQIELQVYGSLERKEYPFCKYYDSYTEKEKDKVFSEMDILAVPSSWMETFGMVVLEALSYGVPVVMTDTVGAKLLLEECENPMGIVLPHDERAWKECLEDLYAHREKIAIYSGNICKANMELDYKEHVGSIKQMYLNVGSKPK